MNKKRAGVFCLFLVVCLFFVWALGVDNVNLVSPENNSWTTANNDTIAFVFNYTGENATASCELFVNGTALGVNSSVLNNTNTTIYANASIGEGSLDWYVNCTNGSSSAISTNWTINIDRTNPFVEIIYPLATNYSSVTQLNFSASDTGNLSSCWYSTNSSVNISTSCSSNVTGLVPSEGSNTWTVYANDSAGNENESSVTFTYDTTNPVASASCTPSSVEVGDTVTCTCSGTDSGSGINSSLTTAGSTPSTSSVGDFTYTCSVTDNVGNSDNDTASYSVTAASSSSSGGSSYYPTYRPDSSEMSNGYRIKLGKNYKVNFQLQGNSHTLTVDDIFSDKVKITIASDPITLEVILGESQKVDVDSDGYYDLEVLVESIAGSRADLILTSIYEKVEEQEVVAEEATEEEGADSFAEEIVSGEVIEEKSNFWVWILVLIVLIIVGIGWRKGFFKKIFKR